MNKFLRKKADSRLVARPWVELRTSFECWSCFFLKLHNIDGKKKQKKNKKAKTNMRYGPAIRVVFSVVFVCVYALRFFNCYVVISVLLLVYFNSEGFSNLNQPKVYKRLTQQKRDKCKLSSDPSEACQNVYWKSSDQSETCAYGHFENDPLFKCKIMVNHIKSWKICTVKRLTLDRKTHFFIVFLQ